jgi:glycosyltransferase involved in cell wall biosynthesis
MRILHVVTLVDDQASYGGAPTVAVNQCVELRRRGHDARIVAGWRGDGPPPELLEGVPAHLFRVRRAAPGRGCSTLRSRALLHWVRDHAGSFDVAHLHLSRDLLPLSVAVLLRRAELPYVVQTHGSLAPDPRLTARLLDRRYTRRALLQARQIFTSTPDDRDAVIRLSGTTEGISLLRNGIVLPDRVPDRSVSGTADVLFLGRLAPGRRVMAFAAAAHRLVQEGVDATFAVVGPDGGDLKELRRFIAEHPELDGRLRYEGALPHDGAVERLRKADVYVQPATDDQSYPMSLLEAMAAGVPSICTTACSLAGVLAREHAAIVANTSDDALFGAMRRVLTDRAARARLSARAAATAASALSITPVVEELEQYYGDGRRRGSQVPRRRAILWITPGITPAHLGTWDGLRQTADLTVALLTDRREPVEPLAGSEADGASTGPRMPRFAGRGYPVIQVPVSGDKSSGALRDMVRDRPDVVVLDGDDRPSTYAAVRRWARRAGVRVVTTDPAKGPSGAGIRAWLIPERSDQVDQDRPRAAPPRTDLARDMIDLQARTRTPGARHA